MVARPIINLQIWLTNTNVITCIFLHIDAIQRVKEINKEIEQVCDELSSFTPRIKEGIAQNKDLSVADIKRMLELNNQYSAKIAEATHIYASHPTIFPVSKN